MPTAPGARPIEPTASSLAARRRALDISRPQLAAWTGVGFAIITRAELGAGRAYRPDEAARLDRVLSAVERVRRELIESTLAAAS